MPGQWSIIENPEYFVKPFAEKYYSEAFSTLDCFIDISLESITVAVFDKHKEQDLYHGLKEVTNLTGLKLADFLKRKGIISSELKGKITTFKTARNNIAHQLSGEYSLLFQDKKYYEKFKTQEEVDLEVRNRLQDSFNNGQKAYLELQSTLKTVCSKGGQNYYAELLSKSLLEKSKNR